MKTQRPVKPEARVERRRIEQRCGQFAWRYIYDVYRPDGSTIVYGTDMLANAEQMAKRSGFNPVRGLTFLVA
jgi:hypothetical protein